MKLIFSILLIIPFSLIAQNPPLPFQNMKGADKMTAEIALPLITWGGTMASIEYRWSNNIGTSKQNQRIAFTGITTGIVLHFGIKKYKETRQYKRLRKKVRRILK